jgi:serine/threonine protein kinase
MEYFEEGDLQILIDSKINSSTYWTEPELLNYASQLIDPLYHLQTKGISHRDLKPKNIFVSKQGTFLKIGDFGLSIKVTQSTMTAVGTPLYVSPLVRSALARAMESGSFKVHHNPFKSDVYSLGLILLYMTTLKSIEDLCSMSTLETKINQRLSKLEDYPILKTTLEKMLKVNESERCDFNELYRFMIQVKTGPLIECLGCRIEKPKKEYFIVKSGEYMCRDCTLSFEHFPEQKM